MPEQNLILRVIIYFILSKCSSNDSKYFYKMCLTTKVLAGYDFLLEWILIGRVTHLDLSNSYPCYSLEVSLTSLCLT